jgi:hypothetical protein
MLHRYPDKSCFIGRYYRERNHFSNLLGLRNRRPRMKGVQSGSRVDE